MSAVQKAKGILADAEKSLRDLMQQELRTHSYVDLAELARLADGLSRLAEGQLNSLPVFTGVAPAKTHQRKSNQRMSRPSREMGHARSSNRKRSYPRFERDGDKLIKVGWSKKGREEYEHRAPKQVVLAFVMHLGQSVRPGKTFVIDDILPAHDSAGEELPSYQVYLSIAWLRDRDAIEKKGRDGYVLNHSTIDGSTFDLLWNDTPERQ